MIFDNYVWSGDAIWIAIGTITSVLLIGGGGAAPVVDCGGVGGWRGRKGAIAQRGGGFGGLGR